MTESGDVRDIVQIVTDPIDSAGLIALMTGLRRDSSGALASFVGVVRNEHQGRRVHHLIYEAYPPMAEQELKRIASELRSRWTIDGVSLVHRLGRLEVGEASVVVVVAAPHRREALEACAFGIERIKQSVPIWKKEFSDQGEEWIIGDPSRP